MKWTAYCLDCKKDVLNGEQWNNGEMVEAQARFHIHGEGGHHDRFLHHRLIVGFIVEHEDNCYCNRKAEVTATLEDWFIHGSTVVGVVSNDGKHRFRPGTQIQTSNVTELSERKILSQGMIIHTVNSQYLLGAKS